MKTTTPKNITKFDSPSFTGYRVMLQRQGTGYRRYVPTAKRTEKTPEARMKGALADAVKDLAELLSIIDSKASMRGGALTLKARKAIIGMGFIIVDSTKSV